MELLSQQRLHKAIKDTFYRPADNLQKHLLKTYINLRIGMALVGLVFPLLLFVVGYVVYGLKLQESMSAYYHAANNGGLTRDLFVGILLAMGLFLILYKGYTNEENWVLNLAGILAILVAIIPMQWNCEPQCRTFTFHGFFAVSFFVCIAYVCIFRAKDTLKLVNDEASRESYEKRYKIFGVLMIAAPLIAWGLKIITQSPFTFVVEALSVWFFAGYWWYKSREIESTNAELRVLTGQLDTIRSSLDNRTAEDSP